MLNTWNNPYMKQKKYKYQVTTPNTKISSTNYSYWRNFQFSEAVSSAFLSPTANNQDISEATLKLEETLWNISHRSHCIFIWGGMISIGQQNITPQNTTEQILFDFYRATLAAFAKWQCLVLGNQAKFAFVTRHLWNKRWRPMWRSNWLKHRAHRSAQIPKVKVKCPRQDGVDVGCTIQQ